MRGEKVRIPKVLNNPWIVSFIQKELEKKRGVAKIRKLIEEKFNIHVDSNVFRNYLRGKYYDLRSPEERISKYKKEYSPED